MTDIPALAAPPAGVDADDWDAACAAIRGYCGWHIAPSVDAELVLDGSGSRTQFLPTLRLTALTSISNDGQPVTDPEWSQAGMVRGPWRWTSRWRGVSVSMTHGYDECPAEIVAIAKDLVKAAGRVAVASQDAGPYRVTYSSAAAAIQAGVVGLSDEQKQTLRRGGYWIDPVA